MTSSIALQNSAYIYIGGQKKGYKIIANYFVKLNNIFFLYIVNVMYEGHLESNAHSSL